MQKILITGSKGQLGTDCLDVFKDAPVLLGVDLPEVDLSDRFPCLETLDRLQPELIVNCAAYTAVDACETDANCWKANADLPGHLAEWTEANNAFLVHVSTDYVFPGDKPLFDGTVETDEPNPISEYGKSKLAGERAIAQRTKRFAILRTAWLYGAHGNNFLKTMLRLTLQNPGKQFKVVADQYGSPTWSYTLAQQIQAVAEKQATGIFHASSEGHCSWFDLACAFLDELAVEHNFVSCTSDEFSTPTKRPANSILENAHAKELDMNVFRDWKDELKLFVQQNAGAILKEYS
ncbi:dTDP-4-dehydrorhamnose reductase [Pontiella sulfatireligans]|uniref:dTDP-4-dehydrorhamnose reductase n=1 Tax=Pontiella sulfatireligans TaxID=2750658 RepID=A0A6C2UEA4_9BACT|nr:dTDP-4-dehydrorhamnose reductase [Pontiella sulfatireligans]VGO18239.1 dTDP-4-dehydrorhamnose reductase [Pontiella sulfatireligans]